jgi:pyrroline-5-carboxylate reductase
MPRRSPPPIQRIKRRRKPADPAPRRPLGFIGGGNMAGALIKGLLESNAYRARQIWVSEKLPDQRRKLERSYGVVTTADNCALAAGSDTVILAVKPQNMDEVLAELRTVAQRRALFVSIAAGVRLRRLENALGTGSRVVRVMPNTPALVGRGMSVVAAGRRASRRDVTHVLTIFRSVGSAEAVPREDLLDAVTGLSGSGPAFVYLFAEGLIDGGRAGGLSQGLAEHLAFETIAGAAAMLKETRKSPAELREMVTSPGGTTLAGLTHLQSMGFLDTVEGAVTSATARSRELAGK